MPSPQSPDGLKRRRIRLAIRHKLPLEVRQTASSSSILLKLQQARHPLRSKASEMPQQDGQKSSRVAGSGRKAIVLSAMVVVIVILAMGAVAGSSALGVSLAARMRADNDALQCANPDLFVGYGVHAGGNSSEGSNASAPNGDPVLRDRSTGRPVEVASVDSTVVDGHLVDRITNHTLLTSAAESTVLNGVLVERGSGKVLQTRPAIEHVTLADGVLTLLNFSALELRTIETLTLTPRGSSLGALSDPSDEETYQVVGVQILKGEGAERVVVLHAASRDEIVLCRSYNRTRSITIVTDTKWRAFLEDVDLDPRSGQLTRASLIARHLLPDGYPDEIAPNGTELYAPMHDGASRRRMAMRRELSARRHLCSWYNIGCHVGRIAGFVADIARAVVDLGVWIGGTLVSTFTNAYNKITQFVSDMWDLIRNWMSRVREWIQDKLDRLMESAGPAIASIVNSALETLDRMVFESRSMNAQEQTAFMMEVNSPLKRLWDQGALIKR